MPAETMETVEAVEEPTLDDLRQRAAELEQRIEARDVATGKEIREQMLAAWEAARERSRRALDRALDRRVEGLLDRRFDPGGIGDLVAVISSAFDRSMRSRIQAFPTKAIARHAHPPAGDPLSRQRAQVTHQIARLEDEERLVARSRRNSTPKED